MLDNQGYGGRTLRVHGGPLAGLAGQLLLLLLLAETVGLGAAGWLAGTACGLTLTVLLVRGLRRNGCTRLGPANSVTLLRAVLVGGVAALVAEAFPATPPEAVAVPLAAVALVLDGVDGRVARGTGTVSAPGARFDMEVDAFLILLLGVPVALVLGPWVLALGAARYLFVAAGWLLPWMRAALPARPWRKVVAAIQGVALTLALADLLPRPVALILVGVALALLTESFGRDVLWLHHRRPRRGRAVGVADEGPSQS